MVKTSRTENSSLWDLGCWVKLMAKRILVVSLTLDVKRHALVWSRVLGEGPYKCMNDSAESVTNDPLSRHPTNRSFDFERTKMTVNKI